MTTDFYMKALEHFEFLNVPCLHLLAIKVQIKEGIDIFNLFKAKKKQKWCSFMSDVNPIIVKGKCG